MCGKIAGVREPYPAARGRQIDSTADLLGPAVSVVLQSVCNFQNSGHDSELVASTAGTREARAK